MKLTQEEKDEVRGMVDSMIDNLNSIKRLFKDNMEESEYERFKRNTLSMLEPGLTSEHSWVVNHVTPLDTMVDDIEVEVDEPVTCPDCDQECDEWGTCNNSECSSNKI